MVLCCFSFPSPTDDEVVITNYPGKRPRNYFKTAGNALSASPQANNYNNNDASLSAPTAPTSYAETGGRTSDYHIMNNEFPFTKADHRIEALAVPSFSQCLDKPIRNRNIIQQSSCFHNDFHKKNNSNSSNNNIENRLLVQVPPGTTAGTTLHVSIPNEPGRILSVQVPVGNHLEFYVTYKPHRRSASPVLSSEYGKPNNYTGNDDTGTWILPASGVLATALASTMVFNHFAES